MSRVLAASVFLATALLAPKAFADADPAFGYVFGSFGLPYRASLNASKPTLIGGTWTTSQNLGPRERPLSLDAAGVGIGIGYDGWNAQVDVRSLGDVKNGALTLGYRLNIQFGNVELWTRLAAGPSLLIEYDQLTATRDLTGGIQGVGEAGVDFFFWKETMAVGIKAAGIPSYTWPATLAADLDLHAGVRLIL